VNCGFKNILSCARLGHSHLLNAKTVAFGRSKLKVQPGAEVYPSRSEYFSYSGTLTDPTS
jgi:hypothetical protein